MDFISEEDFCPVPQYEDLVVGDIKSALNTPISISYQYVDLNKTRYNFCQAFEKKDSKEYFTNMAYFSGRTINQIIDESGHDLHFYRTDCRGRIYKLLLETWPDIDIKPSDTYIFHFALYTSKKKASRGNGIKSPRVYFFVGSNGIIYPMFFDPFHEINPTEY